jgi:transcription elongation factor Elf1
MKDEGGFSYVIKCGVCGIRHLIQEDIIPKKYAIKIARERGWAIGKRFTCSACKKKGGVHV